MSYVCLCRAVSDRRVMAAIRRGARDVQTIGQACRAGTVCGGCHRTLEDMLEARVHAEGKTATAR